MRHLLTTLLLLTAAAHNLRAQYTNRTNYDIKIPLTASELAKDCARTHELLRNSPDEARFSTEIVGDSVFLIHTDASLFASYFTNKGDGVAIDLLHKKQYQCDNIQRLSVTGSHKGFLLEPRYRDDIRKSTNVHPSGLVFAFMGTVPKSFLPNEVEANYILLQNRNLCYYSKVVNVDFHRWGLLENGLFYDTLKGETIEKRHKDLNKVLRFTIPFEKNLATYSKEHFKPLYDSLHLTDYAITHLTIKAFTSIEGTAERNKDLQQQRANSIIAALQSYQTEQVASEVVLNENWVEFLEDIEGTSFDYLMPLTKDEIRLALQEDDLAAKLEPILRKHRKGLIELRLEKRVEYSNAGQAELKKYFDQAIAQKNTEEALYLQQIIFNKVRKQEVPNEFLTQLEVPPSIQFGSLLLNHHAFSFESDNTNVFEAIQAFEDLKAILGDNPKIDYNLCALHLQSWLKTELHFSPQQLKQNIEALRKKGIQENLVTRLLINFHIIQTEYFHQNRKYADKEVSLKFIYKTYRQSRMDDADLVSLSKYFSFFSKFDWAEDILKERVKALDASEDLLFYYINLTISEKELTAAKDYRAFLLNAVNSNTDRFCHFFDSRGNGGATFQLLEDPFLKSTFCENCKGK